MRSSKIRGSAIALVLVAGSPVAVQAIDTPPIVVPLLPSPAPAISARNYVGKGQDENTPLGTAQCTETHLGQGVVLTAGHCVYTSSNQRYESMARFELGGRRYMAMSQTNANYAGNVTIGNFDLAIRYIINGQGANAAPANILALPAFDTSIINRINPTQPVIGPPAPLIEVPFALVGWKQSQAVTSANLLEGVTRPRLGAPDADSPPGAIGAGYAAGEWIYSIRPGSQNNRLNSGDSGGPSFATIDGVERLVGVHSYSGGPDAAIAALDPENPFRYDVDTRVSGFIDFIGGQGNAGAGIWNRYTQGPGTAGWNVNGNWTRQTNPTANILPAANDFVILDPTGGADSGTHTVQISFADSANLMGLANDVRLEISGGVAVNVTGQSGIVNAGIITANGLNSSLVSKTNLDNAGRITATNRAIVSVATGAGATPAMNSYPRPAAGGLPAWVQQFETKSILNDTGGVISILSGSTLNAGAQVDNRAELTFDGGAIGNIGTGLAGSRQIRIDPPAAPAFFRTFETVGLINSATGEVKVFGGSNVAVTGQIENHNIVRIGSSVAGNTFLRVGAGLDNRVGTLPGPTGLPTGFYNGRFNPDPAGNARVFVEAGGRVDVTNGLANLTAAFENTSRGELTVAGNAARTGELIGDYVFNGGQATVQGGGRVEARNQYRNFAGGFTAVSGSGVSGDGIITGAIVNNTGVPAVPGPAVAAGIIEVGNRGVVNARRPGDDIGGLALRNGVDARISIGSGGNVFVAGNAENRGTMMLTRTATGIGQYNGIGVAGPVVVTGNTTNLGTITLAGTPVSRPTINLTDHNYLNGIGGTLTGTGQFVIGAQSNWSMSTVQGASNFNNLNILWDGAGTSTNRVEMEAPSADRGTDANVLALQFAFNSLCFTNSSQAQILDAFNNDGGGGEAIYTRFLGITSDSRVDLNGRTIFYLAADPDCGLDLARFFGGTVAMIPTPSALALLALSGLVAVRRCR